MECQVEQIRHIVDEVRKIRQNLEITLKEGEYNGQMVQALAGIMEDIASITKCEVSKGEWIEFYGLLRENCIPENIIEIIVEWETLVSCWCDDTEIKNLKKEIVVLTQKVEKLTTVMEKQDELIERLYNNNNVRTGWYLEINKAKIDYACEVERVYGVTTKKREKQLIVSLTTYPARMYDLKYTLYSLLHQSLKPDKVILWLASEQFPDKEKNISETILRMQEWGLSIMWCEDIKSYKKLIPAMRMYPDDIIVTADDDIYYPENWLEGLYNSYMQNPRCIHSHRSHRVKIEEGQIASYRAWEKNIESSEKPYQIFATSGSGILYPPCDWAHKDIMNSDMFMRLSPGADDIWFWALGALNHTKIKIVENGMRKLLWVNPRREIGLYNETTLAMTNTKGEMANDIYIHNILEEYPQLMDILHEDS